jgi:hypothetical protein
MDLLRPQLSDDPVVTFAALQLLAENAVWLALLEQATATAARELPAGEPGSAPDLWATEILFHGGSFLVPFGHDAEAEFVVRHLALALFGLEPPLDGVAARSLGRLLSAGLAAGELVMRRSGVDRHTLPVESDAIVVPGTRRLDELRAAAIITDGDLARFLGEGAAAALAPLVADDGPDPLRPFVRRHGALVLALPHHLLPALAAAVVAAGDRSLIAGRYRAGLMATVDTGGLLMGWEPLRVGLPPSDLEIEERIWRADLDKLIHVVVLSDQESDEAPIWPVDADAIGARLDEVAAAVAAHGDVLHLVLVQGLVRPFVYVAADGQRDTRELGMSVAEFELLSYLERGELTLWKYVDALARLRARTDVVAVSILDAFAAWREGGHSFYFSDEPLPSGIYFAAADGELRRELRRTRDFHGVPYVERNRLAWVTRFESALPIPVYLPAPGYADRPALLVEGFAVPVWVFTRLPLPPPLLERAHNFIEMIAYWLWQASTELGPLVATLAEGCQQVWIEVGFADQADWLREHRDDGPRFSVSTDARCRVLVRLRPAILDLLATPDNRGERELLRTIVAAIAALAEAEWEAADVDALIERVAPLGLKKKMLTLDIGADVRLDPRNLPPPRLLDDADAEAVLDEVGAHLAGNYPIGVVAPDQRTVVLGEAVSFHFAEIERLVAELSPNELLESLAAANEAIVAEQARSELTAPTIAACYAGVAEKADELRESIPKLAQTGVGLRFLIEYVVARPPNGSAPLTLSRFDRLLAHASELVNRGSLSDALHLGLEDTEVSITPSGRLGVDRETPFMSGRDQFLSAHARAELAQRRRRLSRLWDDLERPAEPPAGIAAVDEAVHAEFRFSLTELRDLVGALTDAALDHDSGPVAVAKNGLEQELALRLGWEPARVADALELFALEERASFLDPPAQRREETYPWRFSRELSYLRRPLLFRATDAGIEVVYGLRHLHNAWMNLANLIVGGRLVGHSDVFRRAMSELREEEAGSFVDAVADLYRHRTTIVHSNVLKIAGRRLRRDDNTDLGDIDVLAATLATRVLEAVEVKDLSVARTPRELANELNETFATGGPRRSHAEIHLERIAWLERNLADVLAWLGLEEEDAGNWRVEGSIVVDEPLMMPYVRKAPLPVKSYDELAAERAAR